MSYNIKIGSAQAAVVSARGAQMIRTLSEKVASLADENTQLRSLLSQRQHEDSVRELAHEMESKGLNSEMSFEEKVAHISQYNDLSLIRQAVGMAAGSEIRFAKVADVPGRGVDPLTELCLGAD
jgi:hypothetical protein